MAWRHDHPEADRRRQRVQYRKNDGAAKKRKYRLKNAEACGQSARAYYLKNAETRRAYQRGYRAAKRRCRFLDNTP